LLHESNIDVQISHKVAKPLRKIQRKLRDTPPVVGQVCVLAPLWQFFAMFLIEKRFTQQSLLNIQYMMLQKTTAAFVKKEQKAFGHAAKGLWWLLLSGTHARIHAVATLLVTALCIAYRITGQQLMIIVICTGLVWMAELFNTCMERICGLVQPDFHPLVKKIKDMAAAAVLVAAIISVICGSIIFIPKIF
jgi:diacylglycerol kinase (ATP)